MPVTRWHCHVVCTHHSAVTCTALNGIEIRRGFMSSVNPAAYRGPRATRQTGQLHYNKIAFSVRIVGIRNLISARLRGQIRKQQPEPQLPQIRFI